MSRHAPSRYASNEPVARRRGENAKGWFAASWLLLMIFSADALAVSPAELAAEQADLARRFDRLESLAKRIAELAEADDPARAEQLRSAIRASQELALPERFEAIVGLLKKEQLAAAAENQSTLANELERLLQILLADPQAAREERERERLQAMRKALDRQIRTQQQLRGDALGEADKEALAARQAKLEEEVAKLARQARGESSEGGGQPGAPGPPAAGQPQPGPPPGAKAQPSSEASPADPSQRAAQRIAAARQPMQQAIDELRKNERQRAETHQAEAQRRLEDAREEIEQALRQLREEEQQRRLTRLATRLRRMLAEQSNVLTLTRQTDEERPNRGRRATAAAARGLANREDALVAVAEGALRLLREDGGSIAYPEVLEQVREDMRSVAQRFRKVEIGVVTQRLEEEILESLEEAIASLDKTLQELEDRKNQGQQGKPGGAPGEPPVVDKLAELRMIRAIQARILRRTEFWDEMRQAGEATPDEAFDALDALSLRQARLVQALRNLSRRGAR